MSDWFCHRKNKLKREALWGKKIILKRVPSIKEKKNNYNIKEVKSWKILGKKKYLIVFMHNILLQICGKPHLKKLFKNKTNPYSDQSLTGFRKKIT